MATAVTRTMTSLIYSFDRLIKTIEEWEFRSVLQELQDVTKVWSLFVVLLEHGIYLLQIHIQSNTLIA